MAQDKEIAFLLEIAYKSGYSFQMWFTDFEKCGDGTWKWNTVWEDGEPCDAFGVRPMFLGVDNIVSVIQLATRYRK